MNKQVREEFEKAYPMPFACGWNSMTNEYQCIWYEHEGEDEVEAAIAQHNDRLAVWVSSRDSVSVEMPEHLDTDRIGFAAYCAVEVEAAIEACGLRVKP